MDNLLCYNYMKKLSLNYYLLLAVGLLLSSIGMIFTFSIPLLRASEYSFLGVPVAFAPSLIAGFGLLSAYLCYQLHIKGIEKLHIVFGEFSSFCISCAAAAIFIIVVSDSIHKERMLAAILQADDFSVSVTSTNEPRVNVVCLQEGDSSVITVLGKDLHVPDHREFYSFSLAITDLDFVNRFYNSRRGDSKLSMRISEAAK